MRVVEFNTEKVQQRLKQAKLEEARKLMTHLLSSGTSAHEIIDLLCEAINNRQLQFNEYDPEYRKSQFEHDVIECVPAALDVSGFSNEMANRMVGIERLRQELIKVDLA